MPPERFVSRVKPASCSRAIALALRTPLLQWTTIGTERVELAEPLGELGQRDHGRARDPADGDLLGVADVEDERALAPVQQRLQLDAA